MPEAEIVVGVERTFKKYQYQRHFFRGRLAIFLSNFSKAPATGSHPICSVTDLGFDHAQYPAPEGFTPNLSDAARSKGEAWESFLKPLPVGNVFLALVFRLGVGDAGLILKREHYEEITFVILHHLTVEGNRLMNPGDDQRQTVNIPAAIVGQDLVFVIVDCSRNVHLKLVALD
ncbi:hypothetical protein V8D89_004669 [Ganoderma adspersum]